MKRKYILPTFLILQILVLKVLAFFPEFARAQVAEASAATAAPLSAARLAGQGVLRFLGFEIYRARLMRKYDASTAADLVHKLVTG